MRVFIDFDNTLVNSVKAFIERHNSLFNKHLDYKKVTEYDFKPVINYSEEDIISGFHSKFFFSELNTYPEVTTSLRKLKDAGCELVLITRGTLVNIQRKVEWLQKHHVVNDFFDQVIFLTGESTVDMSGAILIDDYSVNHKKSNATYKYAFREISTYRWFSDDARIFNSWKLLVDDILTNVLKVKQHNSVTQRKTKKSKGGDKLGK